MKPFIFPDLPTASGPKRFEKEIKPLNKLKMLYSYTHNNRTITKAPEITILNTKSLNPNNFFESEELAIIDFYKKEHEKLIKVIEENENRLKQSKIILDNLNKEFDYLRKSNPEEFV